MFKRLIEHYRAERAYRAREKYVRERQRGFQDAMRDYFDRKRTLAQMWDPTHLSETPYGVGYLHARRAIRNTEEMERRLEVEKAMSALKPPAPRRKLTTFKMKVVS